jgi:hypothetical protein
MMPGISARTFVFNHHMFNPHNASPNGHMYDNTIDYTWLEGVKATLKHDPSVIMDHARAKAAGHGKDVMAMYVPQDQRPGRRGEDRMTTRTLLGECRGAR